MKKKFKVLFVVTLLVLLFVACEYVLEEVVRVCKPGPFTRIALYIINGFFVIHIILDVIDVIFEVDLRPPLIIAVQNWWDKVITKDRK